MTTSSKRSLPDDPVLLLHAYLDGELDPINALEMERRIAADPALASERRRIEALQQLVRDRMPRELPSPNLRARIEEAIGIRHVTSRPSWRALAASVAIAAIISSSSTWFVLDRPQADVTTNAVVAAHIRALMAPLPTDVTSSDRHTVKPWFNGRIPQSPHVIDLADAGFALAGGRIDVVGREPVPTLVYRRRQHVISLTATNVADPLVKPHRVTTSGYNIIKWVEKDITYWAISDLNAAELEEFVNRIRTAG
jgi:anti-sigma factor RsiW